LDEAMVLPSGDWDKHTLLPVMEKAKRKAQKHKEDAIDAGQFRIYLTIPLGPIAT
jgi:hypothetical protein